MGTRRELEEECGGGDPRGLPSLIHIECYKSGKVSVCVCVERQGREKSILFFLPPFQVLVCMEVFLWNKTQYTYHVYTVGAVSKSVNQALSDSEFSGDLFTHLLLCVPFRCMHTYFNER